MKLAYLAPEFYPPWGGVGIYSTHLIRELSKKMEIDVFTPKRGKGYDARAIEEHFGNKIRIINIGEAKDEFVYNLFFQYGLYRKFPSYMEKEKYDVVHAANLVHMPDVFLKLRNMNENGIVTVHSTIKGQVNGFLQGNKNFFKMQSTEKGSLIAYPVIKSLESMYLKKTKFAISVSRQNERLMKQNGYKGYIETIHNGIDITKWNYNKIKGFGEFERLKGKFVVLYVGRLISLKGIEDFVKAMALLKDADIHFAIAGQGDINQLYRLIAQHGIPSSNFTYLGFVDNAKLPWLYKASSLFVLPSYYENFPISLLEAMSMKCPCIGTDVGDVREIIDDNISGFLVKPADAAELASKIRKVYTDKRLHHRFQKKSFEKAISHFTSKQMAAKTYQFYKKVL